VTELALLACATAAAGMLSAVTGFGGAVILTPVFVAVLGVRDAVAVLTVVQLASNVSRVVLNRDEVDRSIVAAFSAGAVPAAVVGALLFAAAPVQALTRAVGVFLLVAVAWLRLAPPLPRLGRPAFAGLGAASGFGSALVGSVGPFVAPFFLAQGLVRGAYIGTEAATAVVLHLVKLVVYGAVAVLTTTGLLYGLALSPASVAGSWLGRRVVDRMPIAAFRAVVEGGLVVAGVLLVVRG
jgi:uncharacterized membrane protein YfcA